MDALKPEFVFEQERLGIRLPNITRYFLENGLCRILREGELDEHKLIQEIYALINDDQLKKALDNSCVKCGNDKIIKEIFSTLKSSKIR